MVDQCQEYPCPFHVIHLPIMFPFSNNSITNCWLIFSFMVHNTSTNSLSILECKSPESAYLDTDLSFKLSSSKYSFILVILLKSALPISRAPFYSIVRKYFSKKYWILCGLLMSSPSLLLSYVTKEHHSALVFSCSW